MIEHLAFVANAFAPNHPQEFLRGIRISGGRVTASNGVLTMSARVPLDLSCTLDGARLLGAVKHDKKGAPNFHHAGGSRVTVTHGKLRAYVPIVGDEYTFPTPEGSPFVVPDMAEFRETIAALSSVPDPASHTDWMQGIIFDRGSAFVTNGRIAVQRWLASSFDKSINLPIETAKLLRKLKLEPERIISDGRSITFFTNDGDYLRSQLIQSPPRAIEPIIEKACAGLKATDYDDVDNLRDAVAAVLGATDAQTVAVTRNAITAMNGVAAAEHDVTCKTATDVPRIMNAAELRSVFSFATGIHFKSSPCAFIGPSLRGAMVAR